MVDVTSFAPSNSKISKISSSVFFGRAGPSSDRSVQAPNLFALKGGSGSVKNAGVLSQINLN